ncbi:helix-turn-helix domain-containing protein [Raoultibacter phocaeensis]|uniref:helix-turn-helix domain-containing protein n=1 Tax=Raoultibacter phocaeensis TaxID=2479841 RepID=UPI00111B39C4|nr:helix-turn-helix transcriptional regulator [Raoultibacter phocaeensis]
MEMYYPNLDLALTVYMKRVGMTQSDLAKAMPMSSNSFSWKRRGIRDWTLPEAVKIADMVGMSLDDLTGRGPSRRAGRQEAVQWKDPKHG